MSTQVKEFVSKYSVRKTYQPKQCLEPLLPYKLPNRPWTVVGIDLFTFEDTNYLLIADYFSNYFEVHYLTSATSTAVIQKLRAQYSRHGIPDIACFLTIVLNLLVQNSESYRTTGNLNTQHLLQDIHNQVAM